ncbi:hypothetical protein J6590_010570 [Homalodisca vitripennis]|nr:hypothetical protein J6590_010570 [Homalodisca vitripennis]
MRLIHNSHVTQLRGRRGALHLCLDYQSIVAATKTGCLATVQPARPVRQLAVLSPLLQPLSARFLEHGLRYGLLAAATGHNIYRSSTPPLRGWESTTPHQSDVALIADKGETFESQV